MINLVQIFEEQDRLNKETAAKHEEYSKLTRDGLTRNFAFSALCELGEMSNEWAGHKIWKSTRKENREAPCKKCNGRGEACGDACPYCEGGIVNPLREEYIDIVHFVVSVALGFDYDPKEYMNIYEVREVSPEDTYQLILDLYKNLVYANVLIEETRDLPHTEKLLKNNTKERKKVAKALLDILVHLGYSLGFEDAEIEAAYFDKHKINQIRQENNY